MKYLLPFLLFALVTSNALMSQHCVDIPNLPTSQINANINDDVNYPVGTTYWDDGGIEFIKLPSTGPWNHQPGDTTICTSTGNSKFSLSSVANPKTFEISTAYEYGLIVDNDTIFDNANPPASYSGANFSLTSNQNTGINEYTITGDFDTLEILANNLCIFELCINDSVVENCIDIPNLPSNQINNNISDDNNYPVGEPFFVDGNIEFIKTPNTSTWSHQTGDTSICTSGGNMIISVANAPSPKTLNISLAYEYGLVIDGDTVFDNSNPPSSYSGSNFTLTSIQSTGINEYSIAGDFDTLEILANNLCIYEVCLEENTLSNSAYTPESFNNAIVYPNPAKKGTWLSVNSPSIIENLQIFSMSGQLIYSSEKKSNQFKIPLGHRFENGLYVISYFTNEKWHKRKLVIN